MTKTKAWAKSLGISTDATPHEIPDYDEPCARKAEEIARRILALQGVVALAWGAADAGTIQTWLHEQGVWPHLSPRETGLFAHPSQDDDTLNRFRWRVEAAWTLLWVVGMVESLGLPTQGCDTRRLVDELIPALGSDVGQFISTACLRSPGLLLAEDDRTYNLWSAALAAHKRGDPCPSDLKLAVLKERRRAFEWLDGTDDWDDVTCDA